MIKRLIFYPIIIIFFATAGAWWTGLIVVYFVKKHISPVACWGGLIVPALVSVSCLIILIPLYMKKRAQITRSSGPPV
jgi:hypothetical protein